MTDLEPSSDWRTWSITVPSPASEQSATSSPLQTSATLYSISRRIATPFLKFFSIFFEFFLLCPFFCPLPDFSIHACLFRLSSFLLFRTSYIHASVRFIQAIHVNVAERFMALIRKSFTNFQRPALLIFVYFAHSLIYFLQQSIRFSPFFGFYFRALARFSASDQTSDVLPVFRFALSALPGAKIPVSRVLFFSAPPCNFLRVKKMPSPHREEHLP